MNESSYAVISKKAVGRSQNERNELINIIGAETAAKLLMKKKALNDTIYALIVTSEFTNNFR